MKGFRTSAKDVAAELLFDVAGAVENFSGPCARVLAVIDHDLPVHDYEIDSIGRHIGMLIRGVVLDFVIVEDDYVGPQTFPYEAAIGDAHTCGGPGSHLSDGVLEGERMRFADVACD